MARTKVTIKLDTTKSVIKQLLDFSNIMAQGAEFTRGRVIRNWLKGKSPDGSSFRALKKEYADHKVESGRKGIRNLLFSGLMQQGFKVFKKDAYRYVLGFTASERGKARGNNKRTPNMLKVSSKLEKLVKQFIQRKFWKGVK